MEYGAITLDTSIFDQKGLMLESGLLKTLEQFNGKPSHLVLSEIVVREVHAHLAKKASETRGQLQKALRGCVSHLTIDDKKIDEATKLLIPLEDDKEVAKIRIGSFIKKTGAEIVPARGHVELDEIIKKYFHSHPPFSETGKKKNEFPDAIALLSLESWAKKNKTKIVAVSDDSDWEAFAHESEYIDVIKDLAEAIALFQPHSAAIYFCTRLGASLPSGKPEDIYNTIEQYISDAVSEIDSYPDASSAFFWEPDIVKVEFESFEFVTDEGGNALIQAVQGQDESVVVEAKIVVNANASCSFSLSVHDSIDKDYVPIGENSASTDFQFESEILFTLKGDFKNKPEDVDVVDFELLSYPRSIDFGDIEPDWWHDNE